MKRAIVWILILGILLGGCQVTSPQPVQPAEPTVTTLPPETTEVLATVPPETTRPPETTLSTEPAQTEPAPTEPEFEPLALVSELSMEEKVGQLFLARCPDADAAEDITRYHLGGYILFGRDFTLQTPKSITGTIAAYQAAAAIPMLIAVDEEGGTVTRVSSNLAFRSSRFPSPRKLYDQGGMGVVRVAEHEKCQLLTSLGINVNMAPVCDITTDPDAYMYSRSLGQTPEETARFVRSVVRIMEDYNLGSVLKHFPGYGNNTDTHTGIAEDHRTLAELESTDLVPFAAGIKTGCGAILVSHTIVHCLDPELPASLSPQVHDYLRVQMGFDGVIVTDDLIMDAISGQFGPEEAAVLAVLAGNDLLCSSDYKTQYAAVLAAVQSGRIPEEQLNQAVARVLQWKYDLGLLAKERKESAP